MQFSAVFPHIHDLALILSLAVSHTPGEGESLFGRRGGEEEEGRAEGLLRFFY